MKIKELDESDSDVICGINSGFPPCCIEFYVNTWLPALKDLNKLGFLGYVIAESVRSMHCGYIICPECVANNNIVKVKLCNIDECPPHCHARRIRDELNADAPAIQEG